jgi:hypothetical protein
MMTNANSTAGEAGTGTTAAVATGAAASTGPLLELRDVHTYYGRIHALQGVTARTARARPRP